MKTTSRRQQGASLIEVLVTVLILSFGMLSLSGMMAYAVQMPKLSAYRATAVSLASSHVERMRANIAGFDADAYEENSTYPQSTAPSGTPCSYPACDSAGIAAADKLATNTALFQQLPAGGMRVQCDGSCDLRQGDIWVMWEEPGTISSLNNASDECPTGVAFATQPRCVHIKFKL